MQYQHYADDIDHYGLTQGFSLERANNKEFINSWVVYRNINEDFAQSFAEMQTELEGVPFCFWVMHCSDRVAGLVMLPNGIGDFFLIPPEKDANKILILIMPLLEYWSEGQKAINAQAITPCYLDTFHQLGFVLEESRFWMIRPTAPIKVDWSSEWVLTPLNTEHAPIIAGLLKDAFAGDIGEYGKRSLETHIRSVERFFENYAADSNCGRASTLVTESRSSDLAAVCMVEIHKGVPTVRFVTVAPIFQRRGLATQLLKRAINILAPTHDWIKLAVTDGNPAEAVYTNLGFMPGDALHQLSKPVSQQI